MDPFSKLPCQIHLIILGSLSSLREVKALSRASPVMSQQFQAMKCIIGASYVRRTLDDSLIQDAVAIITFPRAPDKLDQEEHYARVCTHLRIWGGKRLEDPTRPETFDESMIIQLEKLCSWIWRYIDDYLSKATSDFLPRAYSRMPTWSLLAQAKTQRTVQHEAQHFDRSVLTREQRHQILKAFLRYELLCRIYGPRGNDLNAVKKNRNGWGNSPDADLPGPLYGNGKHVRQGDVFRFWDWALLNRFEGTSITAPELQLLPCVREYIQTLYEQLISEMFRFDAPSASATATRPEFEIACANYDIGHLFRKRGQIVSLMTSAGLDFLTKILTLGTEDPILTSHALVREIEKDSPCANFTNINSPIHGPVSFETPPFYASSFVRLYRQRAWPLFGESRIGPPLPTEEEYGQVYPLSTYQNRIGWGLDKDTARNELIFHGGGTWASLTANRFRQSFWRLKID